MFEADIMISAIVVSAGKGVRMESQVRKQYLLLAGRPVVCHSLVAVDTCRLIDEIFLVIPEEDFDYCRNKLIAPLNLKKPLKLVSGGETRQDSVGNGLLAISDTGVRCEIVVIHDAVRPFILPEQLEILIIKARKSGACILGLPVSETLKRVNRMGIIEETLERDAVCYSQTPQVFHYDLIRDAHEQARLHGITGTDDAMLVERLGKNVTMISGSRCNIKITTPEDLMLAEVMMETGIWKIDSQVTRVQSEQKGL